MKVSAHFSLGEFIPPDILLQFGDTAIQFLDPRIINLAEFYRSYFCKAVLINNGTTLTERGFRSPISGTGARYSQHKFGRAFDCNVDGLTPLEMYVAILKNSNKFIQKGLSTLENINFTQTWLHSDCRNVQGYTDLNMFTNGVLIVNP